MPGMGGNAHEMNAEEPFRNDFRNLQRVKLLPSLLRQNTLHCPAQRSRLVATQDGGSYFTGQVEKIPIHTLDVSSQRRAIKTLDRKSTRLNSSHQIISYAVFCLKKKKKKIKKMNRHRK